MMILRFYCLVCIGGKHMVYMYVHSSFLPSATSEPQCSKYMELTWHLANQCLCFNHRIVLEKYASVFLLFLNNEMAQVVEILPQPGADDLATQGAEKSAVMTLT